MSRQKFWHTTHPATVPAALPPANHIGALPHSDTHRKAPPGSGHSRDRGPRRPRGGRSGKSPPKERKNSALSPISVRGRRPSGSCRSSIRGGRPRWRVPALDAAGWGSGHRRGPDRARRRPRAQRSPRAPDSLLENTGGFENPARSASAAPDDTSLGGGAPSKRTAREAHRGRPRAEATCFRRGGVFDRWAFLRPGRYRPLDVPFYRGRFRWPTPRAGR